MSKKKSRKYPVTYSLEFISGLVKKNLLRTERRQVRNVSLIYLVPNGTPYISCP